LALVPQPGELLFGFVVLRHARRQLAWIGVTAHPTAEWLAQQLSGTFPWDLAPRYLERDRDRSYGAPFRRRVRSMGIRDRPIAPRSPRQNGHAERLIGSIRHECLDHLVVVNAAHLRRILRGYAEYGRRAHSAGTIARLSLVGGLHPCFRAYLINGRDRCFVGASADPG
jgi:transposase InsO family protein